MLLRFLYPPVLIRDCKIFFHHDTEEPMKFSAHACRVKMAVEICLCAYCSTELTFSLERGLYEDTPLLRNVCESETDTKTKRYRRARESIEAQQRK